MTPDPSRTDPSRTDPTPAAGPRITVRTGSSTGRTRLSAFDAALREAGVADLNLITLSSVIPPGSVLVASREPLDAAHGDRLWCVLASAGAEQHGEVVWAGLGWARDRRSGAGVFVEHHSGARTPCARRSPSASGICAPRGTGTTWRAVRRWPAPTASTTQSARSPSPPTRSRGGSPVPDPMPPAQEVTVVIERDLDDDVVERFHDLYVATFEPMATRAVARQVLHREEFVAEMQDPRVMKYVARDAGGEVVGLTTLTRDLETVPWISPQYFAARYPEHTARDAVFYLGFTLVALQLRRSHVFQSMIEEVVGHVLDARGVCGWDVCAYNEQVLGFSTMIGALLHRHADCTVAQVDSQVYSTVEMHGPPRG